MFGQKIIHTQSCSQDTKNSFLSICRKELWETIFGNHTFFQFD